MARTALVLSTGNSSRRSSIIIIIIIAVMSSTRTSALSDNYCFSCESVNSSLPDCDNVVTDAVTYQVECTGGYCTKLTRSRDGSIFYTLRGCVQGDPVEDFSCSTASPNDYLEIDCSCDTSYCNNSQILSFKILNILLSVVVFVCCCQL